VLAAYSASAIRDVLTPADKALWGQPSVVAAVVLAVIVYSLVNLGLVATAITLHERRINLRRALGTGKEAALVYGTICLGAITALLIDIHPTWALLMIPALLVLHRSVLIRQLRDQARTDPKTGLLNSASWSKDATAHLDRGGNAALLMLDLDNFKSINDRHGHLVGDKHLKGVAEVLRAEVRTTDVVGRFGGEEFVILLPGTSQQDAMAIAERIRRRVESFAVEGFGTVTVSVGVAAHPDHGTTLEEVVNAADLALLAAKTAGRNRTLLFAAPAPDGW
jgi:diguanylate cyclase (GGDEF)-like protein